MQPGRAGFQGFPLNSGEFPSNQERALGRQVQLLPECQLKPHGKLTRLSTVAGQETSLAQCWARKGQSGGASAGLWLWSMLLANELSAGAPALF